MVTKQELRSFIKHDLKQLVEDDPRFLRGISEATLQAIIYRKLDDFAKDSWSVFCGESIPPTNYRADISLYKLTNAGEVDPRFGSIAIEIKAHGQEPDLKEDLSKLTKYLTRVYSDVSFGVLIYMSPYSETEEKLRAKIEEFERRLVIIRLHARE